MTVGRALKRLIDKPGKSPGVAWDINEIDSDVLSVSFQGQPAVVVSKSDLGAASKALYSLAHAIVSDAGKRNARKHRINSGQTAAVSCDYFWSKIDASTPRGVKIQLLGKGGVAIYSHYDGKNPFFTHWAPLPKIPKI